MNDVQVAPASTSTAPLFGLGLDVGGTQCRWALTAGNGDLLAQGVAPGWTALQLGSEAGRNTIAQALQPLAAAVTAAVEAATTAALTAALTVAQTLAQTASQTASQTVAPTAAVTATLATPVATTATEAVTAAPQARIGRLVAGVTGFDPGQHDDLAALLGSVFGLPAPALRLMNDIELACHAAFAPGTGLVLYAGTGAVAAAIDSGGKLHRAGGRGLAIDDAGGGAWIAQQALRAVWRAEDDAPGAWRHSLLARRLFDAMGGTDWAATRAWVYQGPGSDRGTLGRLALEVAAAAQAGDATALAILQAAGSELARPALALLRRLGLRPVALAGRVWALHPAVEASCRSTLAAALPVAPAVQRASRPAHLAAARMAAAALSAAASTGANPAPANSAPVNPAPAKITPSGDARR